MHINLFDNVESFCDLFVNTPGNIADFLYQNANLRQIM